MASRPPAPSGNPADSSGQRSPLVNMIEAKTHLSGLVEAIETGAETVVVIAGKGRPVSQLTSLQSAERPRRLGITRGQFTAPDSLDADNPLIAELFEKG